MNNALSIEPGRLSDKGDAVLTAYAFPNREGLQLSPSFSLSNNLLAAQLTTAAAAARSHHA